MTVLMLYGGVIGNIAPPESLKRKTVSYFFYSFFPAATEFMQVCLKVINLFAEMCCTL